MSPEAEALIAKAKEVFHAVEVPFSDAEAGLARPLAPSDDVREAAQARRAEPRRAVGPPSPLSRILSSREPVAAPTVTDKRVDAAWRAMWERCCAAWRPELGSEPTVFANAMKSQAYQAALNKLEEHLAVRPISPLQIGSACATFERTWRGLVGAQGQQARKPRDVGSGSPGKPWRSKTAPVAGPDEGRAAPQAVPVRPVDDAGHGPLDRPHRQRLLWPDGEREGGPDRGEDDVPPTLAVGKL